MAFFLDTRLEALAQAEARGQRKARQARPVRVGAAPVEGWVTRRTFGQGNRFPQECVRPGCPDREKIPTGKGVLTKGPAGWEVLHASCN